MSGVGGDGIQPGYSYYQQQPPQQYGQPLQQYGQPPQQYGQPPLPSPSVEQQPPVKAPTKSKRKGCIIALIAAAVLLLIVGGICIWYFGFYKPEHDSSSSSESSYSGTDDGKGHTTYNSSQGPPTVKSPTGKTVDIPNYPLKRVFYGMAYVPLNAQLPTCYNTQQSVDDELVLLSQVTRRVRLYGTDCNVFEYTLNAIQRLKLDLKILAGIWIDQDNATYTRQEASLFTTIQKYNGWKDLEGISVGNEVIFDKATSMEILLERIAAVKQKVIAAGHADIPVFTSDVQFTVKQPLTNHEDVAAVNLHPFFSGVGIQGAAAWYWDFMEKTVKPGLLSSTVAVNGTVGGGGGRGRGLGGGAAAEAATGPEPSPLAPHSAKPLTVSETGPVAAGAPSKMPIWVTEVGWPTFPSSSVSGASVPSIENLQTFIDTWLCNANSKPDMPYYFFEFFDAPWKMWPGSAIEGFWGLMTIDKRLKVKLPDCLAQ